MWNSRARHPPPAASDAASPGDPWVGNAWSAVEPEAAGATVQKGNGATARCGVAETLRDNNPEEAMGLLHVYP